MRIIPVVVFAVLLIGCPRFEASGPRFTTATRPDAGTPTRTSATVQHGFDRYVLDGIAPTLSAPPPPISGGTMFIQSGNVIVADPDRDRIWVVNATTRETVATHELRAGDEPGRVHGFGERSFAILRGTGELYALQGRTRVRVCDRARGVLAEAERVLVTCAEGAVVQLNAEGTRIEKRVPVAQDARDIVATASGRYFVSTFQSATIHELTRDLAPIAVVARRPSASSATLSGRVVQTAYRMRAVVDEQGSETLMLSVQLETEAPLTTLGGSAAAYYATTDSTGCTGPIVSAIERITLSEGDSLRGDNSLILPLGNAPVPVDVAATNSDEWLVVSAARQDMDGVARVQLRGQARCGATTMADADARHLTAIEPLGEGRFVVFRRDTAELMFFANFFALHSAVRLSEDRKIDLGHGLFFGASRRQVACASCHAEGESDGHVWNFPGGPVLTPPIFSGIANTAPFHWRGDQRSMAGLLSETMVTRMGAPVLSRTGEAALTGWMDEGVRETEPLVTAMNETTDPRGSIAEGEAYFRGAGECATCHSGDLYTDNRNHNVGTGGTMQTPSLVGVRHRTRLLHDGAVVGLESLLRSNHRLHGKMPVQNAEMRAHLLAFLRTL